MRELRQEKIISLFVFGLVSLFLVWILTPPRDFSEGAIVTIEEGLGLLELSERLEEEDIVRSSAVFRIIAIIFGGERGMKAGQYYFEDRTNPFSVAWRIEEGDYRIETVKLTIPEGFNTKKISALFDEERFAFFDNELFEMYAPEGYLFPDTYFVPVTATASSTIKLLRDNFVRKIFSLMPEVELSGRSLEEVLTMASLLEAEVKSKEEMEIASGILWKRLSLGIPLQVDAYRPTYEFQGLPEFPINNPGLVAIEAALHPTTTPYLYFLTDEEGNAHYARTYDEHQANINKYLRN